MAKGTRLTHKQVVAAHLKAIGIDVSGVNIKYPPVVHLVKVGARRQWRLF